MQPGPSGGTHSPSGTRKTRTPRPHHRRPRPRKAADSGKKDHEPDPPADTDDAENLNTEASSDQAEESSQALRIFRRPRTRAVSPYVPRSDAADSTLQQLIHHYTTVVATRTVTPVGPRHEWFPFAAVDEALFHAVMSHTAAHSAYLRKASLPHDAVYFWHTGEAIRLVNARLRDGGDKAASDGTICAVCCLTQQQAFGGSVENTRMHLNGLLQLVRTAGGLLSIRVNPKTRRFVLLTDLASSITLQKKFYLQPPLQSQNLTLYFGAPTPSTESYARTLSIRLYNFTDSSRLSTQTFKVFWGLRNLSILLEDIRAGYASPDTLNAAELQFTDRVEVLERCAHPLWYSDNTPGSSPTSQQEASAKTAVFRLFGHATLIYIYTILRELPPELSIMKLVAGRIMAELEKYQNLNMLLATFQDLMIWVMFLGGSVAGPREKVFFARQVSKILLVNKIEEESEILAASKRFLWPEALETQVGGAGEDGDRMEVDEQVGDSEMRNKSGLFHVS